MRSSLYWIALGIVLLAGCGTGPPSPATGELETVEPAIEGVLAVNYFADVAAEGEQNDPDWLSRSITDFLISELSRQEFLSITSRSMVRDVLEEQEFALLSGLTEETTQLGRILEADYVLSGDYHLRNGTLTINARLLEVETAEVVRAFHVSGPESGLHRLQEQILYEFLRFAEVPLRTEELAARDYEADTASIRRFYRAEELSEAGRDAEARRELEELLAENPLFTPASERLHAERSDSGILIDGESAVAAADEELRRELYFENLTRSFALYTVSNAYRAVVDDVAIDSRDAQTFQVTVEGKVLLRDDYLTALEEFVEINPYIESEDVDSYRRFRRNLEGWREMPDLFHLRSVGPALPPEENHYGFVRLLLRDASGEAIWRADSNNVEGEYPVYSRETGESSRSEVGLHSYMWVGNYTGSAAMRNRYYFAAVGGELRSPHHHGMWLAQANFEMTLDLPRHDVEALAEVTAQPYFALAGAR